MRWMRRATLLIFASLMLAVPAPALAASIAPPGKSGANQYFETVPSAAGNAAPPQGGNSLSGRGNGTSALNSLGHGRSGAAALSHLGKSGQAAAALAAATAPTPAPGVSGARKHGRGRTSGGLSPAQIQSLSAPSGGSTASALADLLGGSDLGGLGLWLPLLLLAALLAVVAVASFSLVRRRGPAA
jgi:hypothetical protein